MEVVRKQGGTRALSTQGHPHHPTQPPPRSPPSSTLTFKCVECEIAWSEKTEDGMYWQPLESAMNFTNGFLESSSSHSQIRPITAPLCISADGNGQLPISAKALRPRPSVAQAARKTQTEPWLPKSPPAVEERETFACHVQVERTWVFLLERTRERHTSLRRQESAAPPCPKS